MTFTDKLVPFYVWFILGFGLISVLIGIVNFGMLIVTMLTVKGIYVPLWMIPIAILALVGICTFVGWFFEKYEIWNRITSHQNRNLNTEVKRLCDETHELYIEYIEKKKGADPR